MPFDRMAVFLRSRRRVPGASRGGVPRAPPSRPSSRAGPRGPTRPAARSWRCSPAPPRGSRRAASPSTCRWPRCPIPARRPIAERAAGCRRSTTSCPTADRRAERQIGARSGGPMAPASRAPWRWEQLLVDAAVIGGASAGRGGLAVSSDELAAPPRRRSTTTETRRARRSLERQLADLRASRELRAAADRAPRRAARRGDLGRVARRSCARSRRRRCASPSAVLAVLAELEPMAPVGPGRSRRGAARARAAAARPRPCRRRGAATARCSSRPPRRRAGSPSTSCSCPGSPRSSSRGRSSRTRSCLDAAARALGAPSLATAAGARRGRAPGAAARGRRRARARRPLVPARRRRAGAPARALLLRARGAARRRGRAARLRRARRRARRQRRAAGSAGRRRSDPSDAIDEAEYDLALLAPLARRRPGDHRRHGALPPRRQPAPRRARCAPARRRWLRRWTPADGLVDPDAARARRRSRATSSRARSFSPTALQNFAACPYRFFLQAVHRLAPREEPVAIEVLDPLTRGALFHEVQFEVLTRAARRAASCPSGPATLDAAAGASSTTRSTRVAERYARASSRPRSRASGRTAIDAHPRRPARVAAPRGRGRRRLGARALRAVLRPRRPRPRRRPIPASVPEPVAARRRPRSCAARSTWSSGTRAARCAPPTTRPARRARRGGVVVGGGEVLQPVLYALACERLLGEPVEAGGSTTAPPTAATRSASSRSTRRAARRADAVVGDRRRARSRGLPARRARPRAPAGGATTARSAGRTRRSATARKPRERLAEPAIACGACRDRALADQAARDRIRDDLDTTLVVEAAAGTGKTTELVAPHGRRCSRPARATLDRMVARHLHRGGRRRAEAPAARPRSRRARQRRRRAARRERERLDRRAAAARGGAHRDDPLVLRRPAARAARSRRGVDPLFEVAPRRRRRGRSSTRAFDRWFEEQLAAPGEGVRRRPPPAGRATDEARAALLRRAARELVERRDFPTPWRRDDGFDRDAEIDAPGRRAGARSGAAAERGDPRATTSTASLRRDRSASSTTSARREAVRGRDHDGLEAELARSRREPALALDAGSGAVRRLPEGRAARRGATRCTPRLDALRATLPAPTWRRGSATSCGPWSRRYERLKARAGCLDFLDLLLRARDLVRDDAAVRAELQERFTHLFVDEFQDTDPLQAEILLLLAADDPAETRLAARAARRRASSSWSAIRSSRSTASGAPTSRSTRR